MKKIYFLAITFAIFFGTPVATFAATKEPVRKPDFINFTEWYQTKYATTTIPFVSVQIIDYDTLTPLYSFDAHNKMPTASLMKLITAGTFVKQKNIGWGDNIGLLLQDNEGALRSFVGPKDKYVKLNLNKGELASVRNVFASMLIISANNSAHRLARYTAGSVAKFLPLMRATAKRWGLTETTIDDPSGLSLKNQSTAHDMALAVCHAAREPLIARYADLATFSFRTSKGRLIKLQHTIYDIRRESQFYLAGKTGFLFETRFHEAAAMVTPNGNKICAVVLHVHDQVTAEKRLVDFREWADAMYDWNTSTPKI